MPSPTVGRERAEEATESLLHTCLSIAGERCHSTVDRLMRWLRRLNPSPVSPSFAGSATPATSFGSNP